MHVTHTRKYLFSRMQWNYRLLNKRKVLLGLSSGKVVIPTFTTSCWSNINLFDQIQIPLSTICDGMTKKR